MTFQVGGVSIAASGIRPVIWSSAWGAVMEAPLVGVGARPYLAQAADPLSGSSYLDLWDAHHLYLSVLGQFGIVGFLLIMGGVVVLVRAMVSEGTTRRHAALYVGPVRRGGSRCHRGERGLPARLGPPGPGRAGERARVGPGALVEGPGAWSRVWGGVAGRRMLHAVNPRPRPREIDQRRCRRHPDGGGGLRLARVGRDRESGAWRCRSRSSSSCCSVSRCSA